jgi:hypothetical protein
LLTLRRAPLKDYGTTASRTQAGSRPNCRARGREAISSMARDADRAGSVREASRKAVIIHPKEETAPMNRIKTIVCRTALGIAVIVWGASAWAGDVTVVGASWQTRVMPETIDEDTSAQPVPPSPDAPAQPTANASAQPTPNAIAQPGPNVIGQESVADEGAYSEDFAGLENWLTANGWGCWTIDYRYRALASSGFTSTFGTSTPPPAGYAPLSQLNFPLNSSWHGLRIAADKPTWCAHFEWMAAQESMDGQFSDYDWRFAPPPTPGPTYTDLGFADQRFVDGQMIDLGLDFLWRDCNFNLPIEIWPTFGFRWQRFNITGFNGTQVKFNNQSLNPPDEFPGDVITFNQQFYTTYLGGQFRARVRTVLLTFQADWGYTWGYNIDHHLLRDGDRFTMEATHGSSWHLGFTAEVPVSQHLSFGFQVDHLQIWTTGSHHLQNLPLGDDSTWGNGVSVSSNQTSLMAFLRFRL